MHTSSPTLTSADRCLHEIRGMILRGELLPGEKVHQYDLAAKLGTSRIPLREALSTLSAEGILTHRRNSGYQVARFSSSDLAELYLMRRLLENELYRTAALTPATAEIMAELNDELRTVDLRSETERYQSVNEAFHFAPFNTSPLRLVREEVARLWYRSNFYRSLFLHATPSAASVFEDHERMIHAVRENDLERLLAISDEHRHHTEITLTERLAPDLQR